MPSLKTCQTCYNAKIRCDKTQDSGLCDRCLRLKKTCVFAPGRRRNAVAPRSRIDQLEAKLDRVIGSKDPSPLRDDPSGPVGDTIAVQHGPNDSGTDGLPLQSAASADSLDPLACGLLDTHHSQHLLRIFRSRMTSRFPFVVIPDSVTALDLHRERPCIYLAIMAISAFEDFILQRKLSNLFNRVIADKMVRGKTLSIDVLQGLLLQLAWLVSTFCLLFSLIAH